MNAGAPDWLLLVISLPTSSGTARMRIWRALKTLGCVALRDGAYLLPTASNRGEALRELGDECIREGGSAWLLGVLPRSADEADAFRQLFDRSEQYADLRAAWKRANREVASASPAELARLRRRLERDLDAVREIDFFPSEARAEAEAAWVDVAKRIDAVLSPDEPHERAGQVPRLDPARYRGRTWATRRRLWVDRVASAWLIRRFIDPEARFRWLAKPSDCPKTAIGFDFDGAAFTHVGERVTFETLLASFGLESDAALTRIGSVVHALDVGGEPVPEAAGFEAVMAGARERLADDDALLSDMSAVLDSLYLHFQRDTARAGKKKTAA
ncbi:MAG TPA: chromate resistance protein ChrB domain-containing protein [Caldimonas sp.]|nr:chromate resistance protein ChrB domain-containing protein [Caldimonas sp.]HEX2541471.1 chromate resistance protein ChrB domain-containing protein [Caldimonas sp.]